MTTEMSTKSKKAAKAATVHYVLVLDRSGSMQANKIETIDGYNEQVREVQAAAKEAKNGASVKAWLTIFNDKVTPVVQGDDVERVKPLDDSTYIPSGYTAMLDAVGRTIEAVQEKVDPNDTVIFVTISDGQENDSRKWTWSSVADKVQELQGRGNWSFVYVGANQDLSKVSQATGIHRDSTLSYQDTRAGTQTMHSTVTHAHQKHMHAAVASASQGVSYQTTDYFGSDTSDAPADQGWTDSTQPQQRRDKKQATKRAFSDPMLEHLTNSD